MTSDAKKLLEQVLLLGKSERASLATILLESQNADPEDGVEKAWASEVERRIEEIDSGAVAAIPWEEVRERLHRTLNDASRRHIPPRRSRRRRSPLVHRSKPGLRARIP